MPIRIPDALPATETLKRENIFVMTEYRALHQDIRPLRVLILNLMPTKIATETQLMRKLSNTPLQIEVELLRTRSHEATHVAPEHLEAFYRTFDDVVDEHYDGLIITGAPVEQMPFEEVDYWDELCRIMDWSTTHVHSTLHICWGAQAGLYHHYGIDKHDLPQKASGVFEHRIVKPSSPPLVRGFDDCVWAVHSRNTDVRVADARGRARAGDHRALRRGGPLHRQVAGTAAASSCSGTPSTIATPLPRSTRATSPRHRPAGPRQLPPRRRPDARAPAHVEVAGAAALHQLAQLLRLPDDALRHSVRGRLGRVRLRAVSLPDVPSCRGRAVPALPAWCGSAAAPPPSARVRWAVRRVDLLQDRGFLFCHACGRI